MQMSSEGRERAALSAPSVKSTFRVPVGNRKSQTSLSALPPPPTGGIPLMIPGQLGGVIHLNPGSTAQSFPCWLSLVCFRHTCPWEKTNFICLDQWPHSFGRYPELMTSRGGRNCQLSHVVIGISKAYCHHQMLHVVSLIIL